MSTARDELEREMHRLDTDAKAIGYNAPYYRRMLGEHGALGTAQQILATDQPDAAFTRLGELGHPELTVEALVIKRKFRELFTPEEIATARQRLAELNYPIDDET
jgi:hypothetical protein